MGEECWRSSGGRAVARKQWRERSGEEQWWESSGEGQWLGSSGGEAMVWEQWWGSVVRKQCGRSSGGEAVAGEQWWEQWWESSGAGAMVEAVVGEVAQEQWWEKWCGRSLGQQRGRRSCGRAAVVKSIGGSRASEPPDRLLKDFFLQCEGSLGG